MIDNGLNRDTVYYFGLTDDGWATTNRVCFLINQAGYAITVGQTQMLLASLADKGKIQRDTVVYAKDIQVDVWRKNEQPNRQG